MTYARQLLPHDGHHGLPRRQCLDLNVPTELQIMGVITRVEKLGADPKLTEAVLLISRAKELVADYLEGR